VEAACLALEDMLFVGLMHLAIQRNEAHASPFTGERRRKPPLISR
jgi:hypothetical protein